MNKPLAIVAYERLLPGSQLVNRCQDLGYRVQTLSEVSSLPVSAERLKPIVILLDLATPDADVCEAIRQLRSNPETAHIPVIAFSPQSKANLQQQATEAGANLVASDEAALRQLDRLLEHALHVD